MIGGEKLLCLDELAGHASQGATAKVAEVADEADEGVVGGGQGSNVVGLVVGVGARESLAARERHVAVLGEDHLDTVDVERVDDGGDVEVVGVGKAVPANLAKHARNVLSTLVVRVPVANPGVWEGDIGRVETLKDEGVDGWKAFLGSEDDVAGGTVLVDELDSVGGSQRKDSRSGDESRSELHFEGLLVCKGLLLKDC